MNTRNIRRPILAFLAVVALAGCVSEPLRPPPPASPPPPPVDIAKIPDPVPQPEPRSTRGNPPFYEVLGKRYFVRSSAEGYVERGVASWYGPGFHSALTSNGEKYDMYAMTAAHKTLPLPTYVQVTNLRNGRSVTVRVNDRGPFKDGRIIDLSYTAAAKLDMLQDGTTFVEVRALDAQRSAPATTSASALYVQAGAFGSEDNAARLVERLRTQGIDKGFVRRDEINGQKLFRVRVGPIPTVRDFDRVLARLKSFGIADAHLALD